mgnify:CR=1 FL=1
MSTQLPSAPGIEDEMRRRAVDGVERPVAPILADVLERGAGITPADYPGHPLAGIEFQRHWESSAFEAGGRNYRAPAQLVGDFLRKRPSVALGSVAPSYTPGVHMTDLSACVPDYASAAIREALPAFEKQIKGFAMNDAVLTGVEGKPSAPIWK